MDKNETLRNLLIAGGVFLVVMALVPKLLPPPPERAPRSTTEPVRATSPDGAGFGGSEDLASTSEGGDQTPIQSGPSSSPPSRFAALEADEERILAIGAARDDGIEKKNPGPYRMRLLLSNVGASVESATITDHADRLGSDERYRLLSTLERHDGAKYRSLCVEKINIDEVDVPLYDKRWQVGAVSGHSADDAMDGERVEFRMDISDGGTPAVRLIHAFELPRQPRALGRHDLRSDLKIVNLSDQSHRVVVTYRGGVGVPRANSRMDDRYVDHGVRTGDGRIVGARARYANISKNAGAGVALYTPSPSEPQSRFAWAATANTYFTCTIAPLDAAGQDHPTYIAAVSARDLDRNPATTDDATIRFVTGAATLQAGDQRSFDSKIYLGEKDGRAFKAVREYRDRNYYYQISQGFGWCTFTWLVELMISLLNGLHYVVPDYGLAIIILVLIVRILLHPITKKGQVSMVRMQQKMGEFTPKLEELKKRLGNDKARLQQETMKLYREQGINPAGQMFTCLPMFLQMPIWVALYLSLSNNIGMRHEPLHFTWVRDLTAPDALITFKSALPLIGTTFNLLPLLVSVFMYTQQKLQPKPKPNPNATDQQRQQQEMMQKMMPMMSIMMLLFFYKAPSGLNLYIMFSSLFGTYEQMRIRKHIKARELDGALVRASSAKAGRSAKSGKSGKPSFLERIQKMAEDAQKPQGQRSARGKARR